MAQARQAKVLRIAFVQDDKIVKEVWLKPGEPVLVGETAKCTLQLARTSLPGPEYLLFRPQGEGYVLRCAPSMKGKVRGNGPVRNLQKLRGDSSVTFDGDVGEFLLDEADKGQVFIDNVKVLFQFVAPPPVQAAVPLASMDFRPRLLEDDDPVFLGTLAVWTTLASVLAFWVWTSDPRELSLGEIPDRFVRLRVDTPPVEAPKVDEQLVDPNAEGKAEKKEAAEAKEEPAKKGSESKVEQAKRAEATKDQVMQKSRLLARLIATRGKSEAATSSVFGDDSSTAADLDSRVAEAGGITTEASEALRGGSGGEDGPVGIDDLKRGAGGTAEVGEGPKVAPKGKVSAEAGSVEELVGDPAAVKKVVSANQAQVKFCYDERLKAKPNVEGRVEFSWDLEGGKATSVIVVSNSTGDAELAECIRKRITKWTFPPDAEGTVSFPFVLTVPK